MEIISQQQFGEEIDEIAVKWADITGEKNLDTLKEKIDFLNMRTGNENKLSSRLFSTDFVSKEVKTIAALSDLGTALEDIYINDEKMFSSRSNPTLSNSYNLASQVNKLTTITNWDGMSIADSKNLQKNLGRFLKYDIFAEFPAIQKLLFDITEAFEKPSTPTPKVGQGDMSSLNNKLEIFRKYELSNSDDRKKIYDYWASTDLIFKQFDSVIVELDFPEEREWLEEWEDKILTSILRKVNNLEIPKYTVTFNQAPFSSQYADQVTLIKLASDFLTTLTGKDTKAYEDLFSRGSNVDTEEQETIYAEEGGDNTQTSSIDYTKNEEETLLQEVEMVKKMADPLSLLAAYQGEKSSGLYVDSDMATQIKESIEEQLSEVLNDSSVREKVRNSYLKRISSFIEEIKSDLVGEGPYTFAILDDGKNSSFLNGLKNSSNKNYTFTLEYYIPKIDKKTIRFKLMEREYTSYQSYINAVNRMATNVFDEIVEIKSIIPEARYNLNRARGEHQRGSAATPSMQGGNYIPISGKLAEEDESYFADKFFQQLISMFNEYYFEAFDTRYYFYSDKPSFTSKSDSYKKIASLSTKSSKSIRAGVRRSMVKNKKIMIDVKDLETLINFFDKVKMYSQLDGSEAVTIFGEVEPIFRNLHMMDLLPDEGQSKRQAVLSVSKDITNYMGNFLYKILSAGRKNLSIEYKNQPVESYKDIKTNITKLKIFDVLEDEQFISYANDNKMGGKLKELKLLLKNNPLRIKQELGDNKEAMYKAYVEAVDTLREGRGDAIYKAYLETDNVENVEYVLDLIQKEDRIDLYARDIEGIIESRESYNSISYLYGVSPDIIYKVKGLFR